MVPPTLTRARSSGVGKATRVVTSNGSPSDRLDLQCEPAARDRPQGPFVDHRHDQRLRLGVEWPQVAERLVLFRRRLRFAGGLRHWRACLPVPPFRAVQAGGEEAWEETTPMNRGGWYGRTGPARPPCTLERPLSVNGQAQHSDHDHQHDRQCQGRSHS